MFYVLLQFFGLDVFFVFGLVLVFGAADLFGCASSCPPGVRIQQKAFLSSHLIWRCVVEKNF